MVVDVFGTLGVTELLIILALVLILFGATKIPALAKSLGQGVAEFRKARKEDPDGMDKEPVGSSGMTCPSCHRPIGPETLFCTSCGTSLTAERTVCGQCRTALKPQDSYCPKCGTQVPGEHGSV